MYAKQMRRKRQQLSNAESIQILEQGSSGVLALCEADGYPYAVPLSYVYDRNRIYFHCARTGHKLELLKCNEKASFCVIDKDLVLSEKYTTLYRSVIVFGRVRPCMDKDLLEEGLRLLAAKYCPGLDPSGEIAGALEQVCLLVMDIDHMTGKQGKELLHEIS